jgi:hypothetical protein
VPRPPSIQRIYAAVRSGAHTFPEVASTLRMPTTRELNELVSAMVVSGYLRRDYRGHLHCGTQPEPVRTSTGTRTGPGPMGTRPRRDPRRAPDTPAAAIAHPPAGVVPGQRRHERPDYDPAWITGVPNEDRRVKNGMCPYQEQPAGWGQKEIFCGARRSPDEADGPYCRRHAASIREDRGYGGYV